MRRSKRDTSLKQPWIVAGTSHASDPKQPSKASKVITAKSTDGNRSGASRIRYCRGTG